MPKKKQQKMSEAQMDAVTRSTGDELAAQPRV